jgi:hypothetical protein
MCSTPPGSLVDVTGIVGEDMPLGWVNFRQVFGCTRQNVAYFEDGDGSWPVMTSEMPLGLTVTINGLPAGTVLTLPVGEEGADA